MGSNIKIKFLEKFYIYYKKSIVKKIIRLTEADLERIVRRILSESTDKVTSSNSDVKPLLVKEQEDSSHISSIYGQIVDAVKGLGTNENKLINAIYSLNLAYDFQQLTKMFADKKTGYSSFDDMINGEFEIDNYQEVKKIQDILNTLDIKTVFMFSVNRLGMKYFKGGFKSEIPKIPKLEDESKTKDNSVGPFCKSKWEPLLSKAKKYWIEWLSNPITKAKFMKNWEIKNYNEVDNIFKKYIDAINKMKLVYYDKYISGGEQDNSYAFVRPGFEDKIYINCSLDDNEKYNTLVHEIQHILYHIKPLNPTKQVGDVFVNDKTQLMTIHDFVELSAEDKKEGEVINRNMISSLKNHNLNEYALFNWLVRARKQYDKHDKYVCEKTEKMSNIMAIRSHLNIKPGEDITVEMLKPYIRGDKYHTDMSWILMCWALNGFNDIDVMLNKMNQLAFQNTKKDGGSTFA